MIALSIVAEFTLTTSIIELLSLLTPSANEIEWVANKGLYYPFSRGTRGGDVIEFLIQGKVAEYYLRVDSSYSPSISLELMTD